MDQELEKYKERERKRVIKRHRLIRFYSEMVETTTNRIAEIENMLNENSSFNVYGSYARVLELEKLIEINKAFKFRSERRLQTLGRMQ